jgi:Uma2 family endonuclease
MAAGTLVSLEEYLHTSYEPDCDYVDGEVQERNLGEFEHSCSQAEIVYYLRTRYPQLRRRVLSGQRVQVKATRFRIPDVCVLAEDAPREKVIKTAPVLCIEILSPEDRMSRYLDRINDYFAMGVPACWIVDPIARRGWVATPGHLYEAMDGFLRSGEFEMPLASILE